MQSRFNPSKRALYSEVLARVATRLIQLDERHNPEVYRKYRPAAILDLAQRLQRTQSNMLFPYLVSAAKAVNLGSDLATWREWASTHTGDTLRAMHKRPFRPRA